MQKETPKPAPETLNPLAKLGEGIAAQKANGRAEAQNLVGDSEKPFDFDHPKDDPDGFDRVINAWGNAGKSLDKLWAVLSPDTHLQDLDPPPLGSTIAYKDTEEKEPEGWAKDKNGIGFKDWKAGEHARDALAKNPTWNEYVKTASVKYGVPEYTIVGFIQMESNFDPNVRPMDAKTGKPASSALGLAQAIGSTFKTYQRAGHAEADRTNPADAIDFVAWYCKELVKQVDAGIKPGEEDFRITVSDVTNLYRAYHDGPQGYLAARRYEKNPTDGNFKALVWFQRRTMKGPDGTPIYDFQFHKLFAERVSRVANAYHLMAPESTQPLKA